MLNLTRVLSGLGLASVALSVACGVPVGADSEEALTHPGGISTPDPTPRPRPHPLPLPGQGIGTDGDWGGYVPPPVTYPDYGLKDEFGCVPCPEHMPAAIDLESWNGISLWVGGKAGYILSYWTYNTAARTPGDINHGRVELFGVDAATNTVAWHAFGAPDPTTGGIPQPLIAMAGTDEVYCTIKYGAGGYSSGKPPKDPPLPPDGTRGGCTLWCPAWAVEKDVSDWLKVCGVTSGP